MNLNKAKTIVSRLGSHWPTPIGMVGKGADGAVYITNSGKLLKISSGKNPQELRSLVALQNTGFVPKVNQRNLAFVNNYTLFLMNRVGNPGDTVVKLDEFYNYIMLTRSIRPKITQILKNMVSNMHIRGISHGDLHSGNILVSFKPENPRKFKIWFIDFGRSVVIPIGFTERNLFNVTAKINYTWPRKSNLFGSKIVAPVYNIRWVIKHPLSKRKKPNAVIENDFGKVLTYGKKVYASNTRRGQTTLLRKKQNNNRLRNISRNVNLLKLYGTTLTRNEENKIAHERIKRARL